MHINHRRAGIALPGVLVLLACLYSISPAAAQDAPPGRPPSSAPGPASASDHTLGVDSSLESLVARALAVNPTIEAAASRVLAARAAIGPAGARPDPMLMAGLTNLPISDPGFDDFMTMKMIGVTQVFPYPGKLRLSRRAAELEAQSAGARLEGVRLQITRQAKNAFYDLALTDRLLQIIQRNRDLLQTLTQATEASYRVGRAGQEDLLRARVEVARLGEEAAALREQRTSALARLNALLSRPTDHPVPKPEIPQRLARAAVPDSVGAIRFASTSLGARAADSPLLPLDSLQAAAVRRNPNLQAHESMIVAQEARVDLARKAHLPDVDVSLQFNQRDGFSDMVSATVSIPLPMQKGRKQDQLLVENRSTLVALQAEHHALVNDLRAEVATRYSDAERDRAQLGLYVKAILPQARGALESAISGFQVGRADFLTLLERQATLFNYEMHYVRALTDFAKSVAALEQIVGQEVLR